MAIEYNLLTTHAECDSATEKLAFQLQVHEAEKAVQNVADTRADQTHSSIAQQLIRVDARILSVNVILAAPDINELTREKSGEELALLQVQRSRLLRRNRETVGTNRFLDNVEDKQNDALITFLTGALAGIAAHRATLTA